MDCSRPPSTNATVASPETAVSGEVPVSCKGRNEDTDAPTLWPRNGAEHKRIISAVGKSANGQPCSMGQGSEKLLLYTPLQIPLLWRRQALLASCWLNLLTSRVRYILQG